MYTDKDPRADLFAAASKPPATGLIAEAQVATFYDSPPQAEGPGWKSWYHRGNNFVLAYSEGAAGAVFPRGGQPDEYVVYLPDAAKGAVITCGDETVTVPGNSIAFVPPGDSTVTLPDGGVMARLFTVKSTDLAEAASNAGAYDQPRSHIPPFQAWPDPVGGFRIRQYSLDIPAQPGRFGRIFRCTTFMVNIFKIPDGPARYSETVAASSRRFRTMLAGAAGQLCAPSALALDGGYGGLARRSGDQRRIALVSGDPAAGDPHDPRHRSARQ